MILKFILIVAFQSAVVTSALLCYTCSNEPSFDACFKRGRLSQCQPNENACHTEVLRFLRPQGVVFSVSKRCKQSDACENNQIQNPRAAWQPSQCNLKFPSSVCRCCCTKDKCNFGGLYCVVGPACARIPVIEEAGITRCTLGRNEGSICTNICESGHQLIGPKVFSCSKDLGSLQWNVTDSSACIKTTCNPEALNIKNGFASCTNGNNMGSICEFSCREGHVLQNGWPVTSCNTPDNRTNVKWDSDTPTCERFTCLEPDSPANGRLKCSDANRLGSKCVTRCNLGYYKPKAKAATCQLNNNLLPPIWSAEIPGCIEIECPELTSPLNGAMACSNKNLYGSTCQFTCQVGFLLLGNPSIMCDVESQKSAKGGVGIWNNEAPRCRAANCLPPLLAPYQGSIRCSAGTNYGSVCSYSCNEGYELEGHPTVTCTDSTESLIAWDRPVPICKQITCGVIADPLNGKTVCSGIQFGDSCKFSCNEEYYVSGFLATTCGDSNGDGFGDWSNLAPTCEPITCPQLLTIENGVTSCTSENMYKSVCSFACNLGYKISGSGRTTCDKVGDLGRWTNPFPKCEERRCNDISPPPLGFMKCTNDFLVDSVCNFTCAEKHEIYPKTSESLTCMSDEKWNRPLPCCFEQCPPNAIMDMIIAIDSSSSITRDNWVLVIEFIKILIRAFEVNKRMTQFGVFRYNRFVDQQNEIKLNGYSDLDDLMNKIDRIPYNGEGTWTGNALQHILDVSLHPSSGNRLSAPDAILLITDGVTNPGDDIVTPTKGIHDKNVRFLAVFVPPLDEAKKELGIQQLVSITKSRDNVVLVNDGFESLNGIKASVEEFACENACHRDDIDHDISNVIEFDISK